MQCSMDGMSVFSFAISKPGKCIKELSEHFGFDLPSIDYLLIHQANKMIDEKIEKKMEVCVYYKKNVYICNVKTNV